MKEIVYTPADADVRLRPSPAPPAPGSGEALVRIRSVGFCGTDREIVRGGGIAVLPPGSSSLVLGHEMVGVVEECGDDPASPNGAAPARGSVVVCTVRRSCNRCAPCSVGRSDFCLTGDYLEYGITRLDGFARPFILSPVADLIPVPQDIEGLAILAEPLSIVEKAEEQARHVLSRIPGFDLAGPRWGEGRRAVVAGAGPIGLLATYLLRSRGFDVDVLEIRDPAGLSGRLIDAAGARYRLVDPERPDEAARAAGPADLVVEASGDSHLAFALLGALGPGGVLVWIGTCGGDHRASVNVGHHLLRAVLKHHAVVATVNSSADHFRRAIDDLRVLAAQPRFGELITGVYPVDGYREAIWPQGDTIKQVVEFDPSPGRSAT